MQGPRPRNRRRGAWRGYECIRMGFGHGQCSPPARRRLDRPRYRADRLTVAACQLIAKMTNSAPKPPTHRQNDNRLGVTSSSAL